MPIPPYSIDVNGNDNTPEWGYCTVKGCEEEAFPIWTSGEYPDDPDLSLCPTHIGARLFELRAVAEAARSLASGPDSEAWGRLYAALGWADQAGTS